MPKRRAEVLGDARARAVAAGRCIVCRKAPARPGKTTCRACSDAAKLRVQETRKRGGRVGPPVDGLAPLLPFDDRRVNWQWFQEAVRDLLLRLPAFRDVESYGVVGDTQDGIDLRASRGDEHVGIQVKKKTEFGPKAVQDAVAAGACDAHKFILTLSRQATAGARREIDKHPQWELWDQERLSDEARGLPRDVAADYVTRHFGPNWAQAFLGHGLSTTFISRDRFFAPFHPVDRLVRHGWNRAGGEIQLDVLRAFVDNPEQRLAIISGPVGIGKTKLIYDLTSAQLGAELHFLAPGASVDSGSMQELPVGSALIIVDNPEDIHGFEYLMGDLLRRPDAKVLIAVRSGVASIVRDQLLAIGFDTSELVEIALEPLKRAGTIALAQQVLGRADPAVEEWLIKNAGDSPLATILAARLVLDSQGSPAGVEPQSADALIHALFRDVLVGSVSSEHAREATKAVLEVVAALAPARIEDEPWLVGVAKFLGMDADTLVRILDTLESAGVLRRRGHYYSIVPDSLRHALLRRAFLSRARATSVPLTLVRHFLGDANLLRNIALVDLESAAAGGAETFSAVWQYVMDAIITANSFDRTTWLETIKDLGYLKPHEVFELITYLLDHPATNDDTQPFRDVIAVGHDAVVDEIPALIKPIMIRSLDHVRPGLRVLWRLGKNQPHHVSHAPLQIASSLAAYEPGMSIALPLAIVEAVAELIHDGESDSQLHSLLDIVKSLLNKDVASFVSRGPTLAMYKMVVPVDRLRELRDRTINLFIESAGGDDDRRADRAIEALSDLLREPMHQITPPSDETVKAWDRERGMVLDGFEQIVRRGGWPLRELRIASSITWYGRFSPSEFVRKRVADVLTLLSPNSDRDRLRAMVPEFMQHDTFVLVRDMQDIQEGQRRADAFVHRVASDLVATGQTAAAIVDDLARRMDLIERGGFGPLPDWIIGALASAHPVLGAEIGQELLSRHNAKMLSCAAPLVTLALRRNPVEGEVFARQVLATGFNEAAIAVANGLVYRCWSETNREDAVARRQLLVTLLQPDRPLPVRMAAARAARVFSFDHPNEAVRVLVEVPTIADTRLSDELFATIGSPEAKLDDQAIANLIAKLIGPPELEYWPLRFLERVAPSHSRAALELLRARIMHERPSVTAYHPIPLTETQFGDLGKKLAQSPTFEPEFRELLTEVALFDALQAHSLAALFGHIAAVSPAFAMDVIEAHLASPDPRVRAACPRFVRELPHLLLESQVPFVIRILESAAAAGDELASNVEAALIAALVQGAESVTPYEPSGNEVRMQHIASTALQHQMSPRVRRLFERLRKYGERSAQDTIRSAEDVFGPQ